MSDALTPDTPTMATPKQLISFQSPCMAKSTTSTPLQQTTDTPILALPIQQIPISSTLSTVKPTAATPSHQLTESSVPPRSDIVATPLNTLASEQITTTGYINEAEKPTTEHTKAVKRPLFPVEPEDHKKKKAD
ncbi:hypothetical protein Tco_1346120 [Tanacetum coccineum]